VVARVLPGPAFGSTLVVELPARPRTVPPSAERLSDPIRLRRMAVSEVVPLGR